MTYAELQESVAILGLGERCSLKGIKSRYHELVKRCHPDAGNNDAEVDIRRINEAYRNLMDYVGDYRFSFAEEEFYEQNPDERLRNQFMTDPLWGGG